MTFVSLVAGMLLTGLSGIGVGRHVLPYDRLLRFAMALPLGVLVHAFILLVCTVAHLPIVWWTVVPAHLLVFGILRALPTRTIPAYPSRTDALELPLRLSRMLRIACVALLSAQCLYAVVHAAWLPTYHIDSLTNWTMRARVSWLDERLAFDATEERGVAKPQYPFLVHGVQLAAHVVAPSWSDRSANVSTLLLTLASLASLFLVLRRLRGTDIALAGVTALTSIPLLSFHLAQGYGDIHLVTYLALACAFMVTARVVGDPRWLFPSALMVAAACWTKTEGIVVGLLPWLLLLLIDAFSVTVRRPYIMSMLLAAVLAGLFPLFLLWQGLPFTPHESDAAFGVHPEAFGPAFGGLLFSPSMGLTWWAIGLAFAVAMILWKRGDDRLDCRVVIVLLWGVLALLIVLATYTLTPNVRFLLNGESYFRQLLVPAALCIVALAGMFRRKVS